MTREKILQQVIKMLSIMTEAVRIEENSALMEDLGISSMDVLALMSGIEEEFGIVVRERDIRKMSSISDIVDFVESSLRKK